jgi:hypothetical protein
MVHREFHVMNAELIRERRTMRYTCPVCARCMEDGPEGFQLIQAGDRAAVHRAGAVAPVVESVDQDLPPPRTLH